MSETARLSYDLLSRLRLDRDADLSVVRAAESFQKADRVKLMASSAKVAHLMVRASTNVFNVSLQLADSGKVQFKCECETFRNGDYCSHILASVQYYAELLREKEHGAAGIVPGAFAGAYPMKPAAWQSDLEKVFGDLTAPAPPTRRPPSQRHLLFFSVQERATDRWGIYPYSLPAKLFPETFFGDNGELVESGDAVAKFVRVQKIARDAAGVRTMDDSRFPFATPEERQAASLLAAVASFGGYGYYYGSVPAGLYEQVLALLPGSGFVYSGTESTPLRQPLRVCRTGELAPTVQVNTTDAGLSVTPVLLGADDTKPVALRGKIRRPFKSPAYLLTEGGVLTPL
ncbi:MAG: SWIM zinc finger family protein, partial [Armatimonadetes bacterium]|nr:SWIM zinc finger family protein [Armatimonadota bacterium]